MGIKIDSEFLNNLRCADDEVSLCESEENLLRTY